MPIKELIKGNRLEDIQDENANVIGYRIHTGPPGTETADASYCGDARVLEFAFAQYDELRKHPQGVCDSNWSWPAWLLTCNAPADSEDCPQGSGDSSQDLVCYPVSKGRPMQQVEHPCPPSLPESGPPHQEPIRPGSFWRKKGKG